MPRFLSRSAGLRYGFSRRVTLLSSAIGIIIIVFTFATPGINPGEGAAGPSGTSNSITTSSVEYQSISAGLEHTCAVRKDGASFVG